MPGGGSEAELSHRRGRRHQFQNGGRMRPGRGGHLHQRHRPFRPAQPAGRHQENAQARRTKMPCPTVWILTGNQYRLDTRLDPEFNQSVSLYGKNQIWHGRLAGGHRRRFHLCKRRARGQATADYWQANPVPGTEQKVIVGYDRRFLSDQFGRRAAEIFAGNGFQVVLTPEPTPTPSVSFAVKSPRRDRRRDDHRQP